MSANPDFNVEFTILPNDNGKPIATQAVDTGFCVNAKVADEPEKWKPLINFYLLHFLQKGLRFIQIMTRAHLV